MQSALWKIAALLSVMGIGGFVVFNVHQELQLQNAGVSDASGFKSLDAEDANDDGSPAGADIALGPQSDSPGDDPFGLPPESQSEPGTPSLAAGGNDDRFLFSTPNDDDGGAANPFYAANGAQPDGPTEYESPPFDPFGGEATASDAMPAQPGELTTADARLAGHPPRQVEQVGGDNSDDGIDSFNPFSGPDAEDANDPPVQPETAPGSFGFVEFPAQPGDAEESPGRSPAREPAGLPELTFDQNEPELSGDPFGGAAAREPLSNQPEPADAGGDPFGAGFAAEPADAAGPTFELGGASDPQPEMILPEDVADDHTPISPEFADPPAGLSEAWPEETAPATELGPVPNPVLEPAPLSGAGLAFPTDDEAGEAIPQEFDPFGSFDASSDSASDAGPSEPVEAFPFGNAEPVPVPATEPSRFPATSSDTNSGTAISPLSPPPANPLPEVRPINPEARPGVLRPEFVGDATLGVDAPAGPQQPELTIQKLAPPNATVGDPLVYAIKVKNVGNSTAHAVIVEDKIPRGTTLQGSIPQAELIDKRLIWQLGELAPGDEETIRIKVTPTEAGEVGSVATVRFVAEVAATTKITMPKLAMQVQGPDEVAVGERVTFRFQISNTGDGEARNVYIRNLLPAGFEHPGGSDIEYDVGNLKPGETRGVELAVTARDVGQHALQAQLNTGTTVRDEQTASVNVIKSRLLIQRQGPKRRFIGRPADYTTIVSNRSSQTLPRVDIVESLPAGMELAAAPDGGQYNPQKRTITWRLTELPPGGTKTLKTRVVASRQGLLEGTVTAMDASGNQAQLKSALEVAGFASLKVDLDHAGRPVGVGESVAMQLTIRNRGTGAAERVEALFDIPEHLEFVNAEGPVQYEQQGRTVRFAAIDELPANGEQTFKIVLTAAAPGNTPVMAQLSTADLEQPLQETESVIVEGDTP